MRRLEGIISRATRHDVPMFRVTQADTVFRFITTQCI